MENAGEGRVLSSPDDDFPVIVQDVYQLVANLRVLFPILGEYLPHIGNNRYFPASRDSRRAEYLFSHKISNGLKSPKSIFRLGTISVIKTI